VVFERSPPPFLVTPFRQALKSSFLHAERTIELRILRATFLIYRTFPILREWYLFLNPYKRGYTPTQLTWRSQANLFFWPFPFPFARFFLVPPPLERCPNIMPPFLFASPSFGVFLPTDSVSTDPVKTFPPNRSLQILSNNLIEDRRRLKPLFFNFSPTVQGFSFSAFNSE